MKKLLLILILFSLVTVSSPVVSYADDHFSMYKKCLQLANGAEDGPVWESSTCSAAKAAHDDPKNNPLTGPNGVINKIADGVALVAGAVAVIMIIVQGIAMVTSSGDSQRFAQARGGVIFAAIGLVVIILARGLIVFVLNSIK